MNIKMIKKIVATILCISLAFCMVGCGENSDKKQTKSEKDKDGLTKITFCLDWTPNTNHTGLYVAQAKGFYEEAGLEVEIVQPPESGASLMCSAGQAQFAVDAQDTIAAGWDTEDVLNVTAVAAVLQHNSSGIISRKGDGIDSPKGLTGKTYSTWESPIEMAMIENVVNADGGDFDKIKMIPNDITDEPAALKANQTDAIWVFYGWGGINADVEKTECDFWFFKDITPEFDYYTPIIIANNDFLNENPEIAKAFLKATKQGYEYAASNPDEAAQMLIDGDNTGSLAGASELVKKSQEWISKEYISDAEYWGCIDEDRWNAFYGWLYDNKLTKSDLRGTGFTNDYLEK